MSVERSELKVERSAPKGAVFLSYASQDAEAAKRIADALRAAGVEVWFDAEGGLEHGDEWDAKIRKQIKECVLFIAVISANTQAREEGYFRIEWELAAQRALGIASGVAFILPVVIDDTKEPAALVPDRFRSVQWTKLPGGNVPAEVLQRLLKLWSHRTGVLKQAATRESAGREEPSASVPARRSRGPGYAAVAMAVVVGAGILWWMQRRPAAANTAPPAVAPTLSEAAQLTARAYAITLKVGFTREDLATAEALMQKAVELEPGSARAQSVRAWVQACYLMRNWDLSERRLQEVQATANRALAIDPDDADALNALGSIFDKKRVPVEAEKIARRAVAVAPDNYRSRMLLGRALRVQEKRPESMVVLQEAVRRFPDNVLCRYELAVNYSSIGMLLEPVNPADVAAALEQLDAAVTIQPFASAILLKAVLEASGRGDLGRMRAELDRLATLSLTDRTEDRAVYIAMWGGLLERRPERVLAAAKLTARSYFEDAIVAGPKAWGTALAYRLAGKDALARQEWIAAEAALRQRLREQPNELDTLRLATTLAWQEDREGAERLVAPIEAAWREDLTRSRARELGRYYAARGDAAKAVPYLRQVINYNSFLTDHLLPLDPWWDQLRGQPEFEDLLKEAAARVRAGSAAVPAAPKIDEKSVAVLAFANLSDDKANEYFSDGVSEELLNVLAKIPGLKVSARTSAFYFKGKEVPVPEIARQLGVAYVVEGSVRKQGDKVRITAQLIKAADGFHVWSDTFTRDLKDIFAVQDEIAALIAQNLKLNMGLMAPGVRRTVDPAAHQLVLEGRYFWNLRTADGFDRAEVAFTKAIQLDPQFAQAHAGLADVRWIRTAFAAYSGVNFVPGAYSDAETARALALDPTLAEAYPAAGAVLHWSGRLGEAEQLFKKAIALNPNYALAHHWYSLVLEGQGRLDEALGEIDQAVQLDPLSVAALSTRFRYLLMAGRVADALAANEKVLALRRDFFFGTGQHAQALLAAGRRDEALAVARSVVAHQSIEGRYVSDALAVYVLRALGHQAEAVAHVENLVPRLPADSYLRGVALAALDRWDEAEPYLERTPPGLNEIFFWNPLWDRWRDDPRFGRLMAKLNCTEEYQVARATLARMLKEQAAKK